MPSGNDPKQTAHKPSAVRHPRKKGRPQPMDFVSFADQLLDKCYRFTYGMGALLVRSGRRINRHLEIKAKRNRDKRAEKNRKRKAALQRQLRALVRDFCMPFLNVKAAFTDYRDRIQEAKAQGGVDVWEAIWHILLEVLKVCRHIFASILNYAAPIAAVFFLVNTINHYNGLNFGLLLTYGGENLGYITNEAVFENAAEEVKKRIIYEDEAATVEVVTPDEAMEEAPPADNLPEEPTVEEAQKTAQVAEKKRELVKLPEYKLAVVEPYQLMDMDTLTDRLIRASGSEVTQASGLYIDDQFRGASTKPEEVLDVLNDMLNEYETGTEGETIHFVSKIVLKDGLFPVKSLKEVDTIRSMLDGNVSGESFYTVESGDSPSLIADKIGLPLRELTAMNPNIEEEFLPGKQLLVSRSVPMMKIQLTRREIYEEDIPFQTEVEEDAGYFKGYDEITRAGVPGVMEVEANVTYIDGNPVTSTVIKKTVLEEPRSAIRTVGTNVPKAANGSPTGGFIWPVAGGNISYGIWEYAGHTGTDIMAPSGTPIYAAMSGTVTTASSGSWGMGYGTYAVINHGGGLTTLYAHCSKLLVQPGQYVNQGDVIALVGRTGNAFGNHCHLEIRQNAVPLDARKYIGYTSPY